jgi:hypothetical protein
MNVLPCTDVLSGLAVGRLRAICFVERQESPGLNIPFYHYPFRHRSFLLGCKTLQTGLLQVDSRVSRSRSYPFP